MIVKGTKEKLLYVGLQISMWLVVVTVVAIFTILIIRGSGHLSWDFLVEYPKNGMTEGGIYPAIIGTVFVTLISSLFAIPMGIACAVYLSEYAPNHWLTNLIRASIRNLSGVPSIIYGLFGLAIFVDGLGFGNSVLASGLTLGLLTLPYVITVTEEALKNVPVLYREGSLALGATKWETIRHHVIPPATPGILTGCILALSRAAGETAPILFTGVAFYNRYVPTSVFDEFMALPYHLYILSTQHHAIETVRPIAYSTALVLLLIVFLLNLTAFYIRYRQRKS